MDVPLDQASQEPSLLRVGSMVDDRYGVVRLLGKGRFSQTYLVVDRSTHECQNLALKVYYAEYAPIAARECDILTVLKAADPLGHARNILFGGMARDCLGLLLPVLSPYPLSLPRGEPLARTDKLRKITFQLCTALMLLADHGVIHADLKPDNVLCDLIEPRGDVTSVGIRLCDFGNAVWDTESDLLEYFQDFEIQSLSYRAPEVVYGLPFTKAIDMWSLGCLLVELYRGHVLFRSRTRTDLAMEMAGLLSPPPVSYRAGKYFHSYASISNVFDTAYNERTLQDKLTDLMPTADGLFLDLLRGLLHYDAKKRFTPRDCLLHGFLQPVCPLALIGMPSHNTKKMEGMHQGEGGCSEDDSKLNVKSDGEGERTCVPGDRRMRNSRHDRDGGNSNYGHRGGSVDDIDKIHDCKPVHDEISEVPQHTKEIPHRLNAESSKQLLGEYTRKIPGERSSHMSAGQKSMPSRSHSQPHSRSSSLSRLPETHAVGIHNTHAQVKKDTELYFFPSVSPKKGREAPTNPPFARQNIQKVSVDTSHTRQTNASDSQLTSQTGPRTRHGIHHARESYKFRSGSQNMRHSIYQNESDMMLRKTSSDTSHTASYRASHNTSRNVSPVQKRKHPSQSSSELTNQAPDGRYVHDDTEVNTKEIQEAHAHTQLPAQRRAEAHELPPKPTQHDDLGLQTTVASTEVSQGDSVVSKKSITKGRSTRSTKHTLAAEGSQMAKSKRSRIATKNTRGS